MKNVFALITSIVFIFLSCNDSDTKDDSYSRPVFKVIDSLNANDLYTESRWIMYLEYCSDTVKFTTSVKSDGIYSFGELPIVLDTVVLENIAMYDNENSETYIKFGLNFYYDTIPFDWRAVYNTLPYGVYFKLNEPKVHGFYMDGYGSYTNFGNRDSILLLKAKDYLESIGNKANPWFREEAVRRGVLSND